MKRFFFLLLAVGMFHRPLLAQDSDTASAIADRQAAEERYKQMSADVESLLVANLAMQKKVSALEDELQKVREEQTRSANNSNTTTADSLRKLADAIQEVDKNRIADKQKILDAIAKMERNLRSAPPPSANKAPVVPDAPTGPEKGYTHTIGSGDTLSGIVASYNSAFKAKGMKTISLKDVMDANPKVNVNALKIGQKIFVPAPAE